MLPLPPCPAAGEGFYEEPLPEEGRVGGQGAGSLFRWEVVVISLNG